MANSAIQLSVSRRYGNSWNALTLLDSVADQEPSDFDKTRMAGRFITAAISQLQGKTYKRASPYTASFDET